jgi:hypothetical protein
VFEIGFRKLRDVILIENGNQAVIYPVDRVITTMGKI